MRFDAAAIAQTASVAQHVDQLFVDDLDDLLARLERFVDFLANGALAHRFDEVLHDRQGDIRLQQGHADFSHGGFDVSFLDSAALAQAFEGCIQSL